MTLGKAGRTITTQCGGSHILLLPVPTDTAKIADHALLVPGTAADGEACLLCLGSTVTQIGILPSIETIAQRTVGAIDVLPLGTIYLVTNHRIEMMVFHIEYVIQGIGPCDAKAVACTL